MYHLHRYEHEGAIGASDRMIEAAPRKRPDRGWECRMKPCMGAVESLSSFDLPYWESANASLYPIELSMDLDRGEAV